MRSHWHQSDCASGHESELGWRWLSSKAHDLLARGNNNDGTEERTLMHKPGCRAGALRASFILTVSLPPTQLILGRQGYCCLRFCFFVCSRFISINCTPLKCQKRLHRCEIKLKQHSTTLDWAKSTMIFWANVSVIAALILLFSCYFHP